MKSSLIYSSIASAVILASLPLPSYAQNLSFPLTISQACYLDGSLDGSWAYYDCSNRPSRDCQSFKQERILIDRLDRNKNVKKTCRNETSQAGKRVAKRRYSDGFGDARRIERRFAEQLRANPPR